MIKMRFLNYHCIVLERYSDGTSLISFYIKETKLKNLLEHNIKILRISREEINNNRYYVRAIVSDTVLKE